MCKKESLQHDLIKKYRITWTRNINHPSLKQSDTKMQEDYYGSKICPDAPMGNIYWWNFNHAACHLLWQRHTEIIIPYIHLEVKCLSPDLSFHKKAGGENSRYTGWIIWVVIVWWKTWVMVFVCWSSVHSSGSPARSNWQGEGAIRLTAWCP